MIFKEYIPKDIENTFVNMSEFASEVKINGVTVTVVEDRDQLQFRIKENYGGLVIGDVLFYITPKEYEKIPQMKAKPEVNQAINYDGKACTIIDSGEQDGLYEIIIQKVGGY